MVIHKPCTSFVDTETIDARLRFSVAGSFAELHVDDGEIPIREGRFSADVWLRTMESADEGASYENEACRLRLLTCHSQFLS